MTDISCIGLQAFPHGADQTPSTAADRDGRQPAKLRILLIAEACNPTWSSVPLVGYNLARSLSARDDLEVTLVSQIRNRDALEADSIAKSAELNYVDNEFAARPLYRMAQLLRGGDGLAWTMNTAMAWPSQMIFEKMIYRQFRSEFERGRWDLVHRLTPLSPVMGSPLAKRIKTPMLIGPLNGGLPWPREFRDLRRQEREWLIPLRRIYRVLPYYRSMYRRLAGVIAGSRHTASEIPRCCRGKQFFLPENGVDPKRFPLAARWPEPLGQFRFITVGRLVPVKAIDLLLEAFAGSPHLKNCSLQIVGDGPDRSRLENQARSLGLSDSAHFLGWLDQPQLAAELASAQAFVFPSIKDFGGGAVLEAMSAALPSIVVNYGGPGELVTDKTGIRLPIQPRHELIGSLRGAMEQLAGNSPLCRQLGKAAAEKIRTEFTWEAKAERIVQIYRQLF